MSTLLHLIKFNFHFYRLRFILMSLGALLIITVSVLLENDLAEQGSTMFRISGALLTIIFATRISAKSALYLDMKHLIAIPLSNLQIVLAQAVADAVLLTPVWSVFALGLCFSFSQLNWMFVFPVVFTLVIFAQVFAFQKSIDILRMQYTRSSIKNSFVFFHKYLNSLFNFYVLGAFVVILYYQTKDNFLLMQYAFLIISVFLLIFVSFQTVKLLKDETLSYFFWKRDLKTSGFKVIFFILPFLFIALKYLKNDSGNDELIKTLKANSIVGGATYHDFYLAIIQKDTKSLMQYLEAQKEVPWEQEVLGKTPLHYTIELGKNKAFTTLIELRPDLLEQEETKYGNTLLHTAMKSCNIIASKKLIDMGADINALNKNGDSPLIIAAKNRCSGGVVYLTKHNSNLEITNKEGKKFTNYIRKSLYQGLFIDEQSQIKRDIASTKLTETSEVSEKESQPPEQLLQQE